MDDNDDTEYLESKFRLRLGIVAVSNRLEYLFCTRIIGDWKNYFMSLEPFVVDDKFVQVSFDKSPTFMELFYVHIK